MQMHKIGILFFKYIIFLNMGQLFVCLFVCLFVVLFFNKKYFVLSGN